MTSLHSVQICRPFLQEHCIACQAWGHLRALQRTQQRWGPTAFSKALSSAVEACNYRAEILRRGHITRPMQCVCCRAGLASKSNNIYLGPVCVILKYDVTGGEKNEQCSVPPTWCPVQRRRHGAYSQPLFTLFAKRQNINRAAVNLC